jgi:hypothetical protein
MGKVKRILSDIKDYLLRRFIYVKISIRRIGRSLVRESKETKLASKILVELIKGKNVKPEEIDFLKGQSVDLGKALAIIGLQAVPGSNFAIIAIEKALQKYDFSLFPTKQKQLSQTGNKNGKGISSADGDTAQTKVV